MTAAVQVSAARGVDQIIAAIRRIQQADARLPSERDLADRLNVKRHQLRKALDVMRRSGDLQAGRPRRSHSAQPRYGEELVRVTNPLEVIELRLMMEPGLARAASVRASPLEIARITQAATTAETATSGEADLAFHLAVVGAARNHLAAEFYRMLRQVGVDARVRISGMASPTCPKRIARRDAEHRAIADAIAQRDPDAAERAMRTHLQSVLQQINERSSAGAFAA